MPRMADSGRDPLVAEMKFKVQMKDPDVLHDAISEAVDISVTMISEDADEREAVAEERRKKIRALCAKWFEYGEYLVVEIDTEAETCTVLPV